MPIEGLNLELRELGKLKLGEEAADRPRALNTWRLVSPHRDLIAAAYQLYGGNPQDNKDGSYEVITETTELEVLLPPQDLAANQWFEHWQAGGLQRRCTGTALITFDQTEPAGYRKTAPCLCDEENRPERLCKPTTVLRVVLPELPDIGIWRLTTKSVYAARELPGVVSLILEASSAVLAPAVLGIDSRTQKSPGQPPHHFKIPVIRSRGRLTDLLEGTALELSSPAPNSLPASPTGGAGEEQPENRPSGPQNRAQEAPKPDSGPTTPGNPVPAEWDEVGALLARVTPDTIEGLQLAQMIQTLEELEEAMQKVKLWPAYALDGLAARWLGDDKPNWRDAMGHDIKAFTIRAIMHATREVERTGLGTRALQRHRQNEETPADERQPT